MNLSLFKVKNSLFLSVFLVLITCCKSFGQFPPTPSNYFYVIPDPLTIDIQRACFDSNQDVRIRTSVYPSLSSCWWTIPAFPPILPDPTERNMADFDTVILSFPPTVPFSNNSMYSSGRTVRAVWHWRCPSDSVYSGDYTTYSIPTSSLLNLCGVSLKSYTIQFPYGENRMKSLGDYSSIPNCVFFLSSLQSYINSLQSAYKQYLINQYFIGLYTNLTPVRPPSPNSELCNHVIMWADLEWLDNDGITWHRYDLPGYNAGTGQPNQSANDNKLRDQEIEFKTLFLTNTETYRFAMADVNFDRNIDGNDFVAFTNSFAIGDASVDPLADINGDGTIDGADFIDFINAYTGV